MDSELNELDESVRMEWKDIFAVMIAMLQLLLPVIIAFIAIYWIIMLLLMKFWLKA